MKRKIWRSVLMLAPIIWIADASAACLKYYPASVSVSGRILEQQAYGAPNYGENPDTDDIEIYPLLVLDNFTCVDSGGQEEPSQSSIVAIQLSFGVGKFNKMWMDKHVAVTGTLFRATTGHDRTPVILEPSEVTLSPAPTFVGRSRNIQ